MYGIFIMGKNNCSIFKKIPGELTDCSEKKAYAKQLKELRKAMVDHLSERGDDYVKNGELVTLEKTILYSPNFPQKI